MKLPNIPYVVLFGAPGVGKGTVASFISKHHDIPNFSMGDYFRSIVKGRRPIESISEDTEYARKLEQTLKSGQLVDDDMVVEVIQKLDESPLFRNKKAIMLDGVPRTLFQAEKLQELLNIKLVIHFFNQEDILVQKIAGRRVCETCNNTYNVAQIDQDGYKMAPLLPANGKHPLECDKCPGSVLVQRSDDEEATVRERIQTYNKKTRPIIEYFEQQNVKVLDFECKKGSKDSPRVAELLKETLKI